jgi:hypothetical protein
MKVQASLTIRLIKEGLIFYPAGKWDKMATYERTMETCPFVLYDTGKPDTDLYYYLNKEVKIVGNASNVNPKSDYAANGSKATWRPLENVGYVFAKFAMIDHALLAGAVAYQNKMFSQAGTLNGNPSTDYKHPSFKPNIVINWLTGVFEAIHGTFSGVLSGVTGTFHKLSSPAANSDAYIGFSGNEFHFNGDMWHQGNEGVGIFMAKSISVRGMFGHRGLRTREVKNSRGTLNFITDGVVLHVNVDNIGMPIDCLSVSSDSNIIISLSTAYLSYKKLTVINANDVQSIRIITINGTYDMGGGVVWELIYVPSNNMYPRKSGWMLVSHDNNW